jgi:hypothetical protein
MPSAMVVAWWSRTWKRQAAVVAIWAAVWRAMSAMTGPYPGSSPGSSSSMARVPNPMVMVMAP